MNLKRMLKKLLALLLSVTLTSSFLPPGMGWTEVQDVVDTKDQNEVLLYKGDLVGLKVYSLTRISISQSGIIDIVNADVNQVLLIGQAEGETQIFIWDELGKRSVVARVFPEDLDMTMVKIDNLIKAANIMGVTLTKNDMERKIIVSGRLTKDDKKRVDEEILSKYSGVIINMLRVEGDLIQIDAQISELNVTLSSIMGIDWGVGEIEGFALPYQETLPTSDGSFGDLFKIGKFSRTTAITATVNAIITEGKGRVLSKPSIVVTNGEQATFLVGGEIPIRTTTTSAGGNSVQENVTFKEYGVDLKVTPEIIDNKINTELNVSIRDIDAANAVEDNVAFTTRTASTKLMLNDGQTIVLAGLIKHNVSDTVKRIPFLSAIPVVGVLFRKKSHTPDQETEVVISLTPRILRQKMLEKEYPQSAQPETESTEAPPASAGQADLAEEQALAVSASSQEPSSEAAEMGPLDGKTKQAVSHYVQAVQKRIAQNISFPYEAKEKGWKGTVVLNLKILSDGTLADVNVREASGQSIFDRDALNTAQILAPYDPFPAELPLEELSVTIPIVYSQESVLEPNAEK